MKLLHLLPMTAMALASMSAMADSTTDLVNALVAKGVLTEEEGKLLSKGHESEKAAQDKVLEKSSKAGGKVTISDAIDNATIYGDIRARYEFRRGEDSSNITEDRERGRYKLVLGVKTNAGDFYSDIALSMGANGRSDNSTFGNAANSSNGSNTKETVYVKRALLGWKVTDWLKVEAGRVANPLYTTPMVWDGDLTFEGLVEKVEYQWGKVNLFANFAQSQYIGDRQDFTIINNDRVTNDLMAFQGGAKFDINERVSAKAALTFTKFSNDHAPGAGPFVPGLGSDSGRGVSLGTTTTATNDIRTIEIPAEVVFKLNDSMKLMAFSDYVTNLDGKDRYEAAVAAATASSASRGAVIRSAGHDDKAWLLGVGLSSQQGKQPKRGDWSSRLWYQDVGIYALDPNTVDSDFMDSRVNMKGIVLKGEYFLRDNVVVNLAVGHANRKNDKLSAAASQSDIALNLDSFSLYQMDITYRF